MDMRYCCLSMLAMALLHWCAGSFYCCTAWLLLLGDRPVHAFQVLPTPPVAYFSSHRRNKAALRLRLRSPRLAASSTSATTTDDDSNLFFATTAPVSDSAHLSVAAATTGTAPSTENSPVQQQKQRVLGSQELLMLPRQYGPGSTTFPPMNHVAVYVLSSTPTVPDLQKAIDSVIVAHPLLSAHVQGDGEPTRRIDMMQMVRDGEPSPLTFVVDNTITADRVLRLVESDNVRASWQTAFVRDLDDGSWCQTDQGPLWKVELHIHQLKSPTQGAKSDLDECALLFSFNHAISDQSSANRLTDAILQSLSEIESTGGSVVTPPVLQSMPVALEDSVLGREQRWSDVQTAGVTFDTIQYVAGKAAEGLKNPVILPDPTPIGGSSKDGDNDENSKSNAGNPLTWALTIISGRAAGGEDSDSRARRSTVQFRSLSQSATEALAVACRARGVSMSNALTAAATFTTTDFIGTRPVGGIQGGEQRKMRNYKALQSLDMRRFGAQLDKGETVACMAGSHDLIHGSLADWSGETLRKNPSEKRLAQFWSLAADGKQQTEDFIAGGGPIQAVRVFDFAMTIADLNNLVHLTAQSKDTKGRAYSVGVTNVGVYERQVGFQRKGETERHLLKIQNGKYKIKDVYYATPHVTSGCLFQVSGMTLDGQLKLTFNPVEPIISSETNARFADAFVGLLEKISGKPEDHNDDLDAKTSPTTLLSLLPTITAGIGFLAVASHAGAWSRFISSVLEMKANIADPADFWAALNFWIFFAVGHPVLQPILWISDVLHGSPGPMIAGLVPVSFLLGNLIAITVILNSKEIRNAVNIALFAAFLAYVGAGLDGTAGLGDFNLALDDSYNGRIVKGCPTYEEVRQPSMNDFDLEKYQGLWYEQKFHDWTQFKEVYDTTLAIRLTEGGLGWTDDFAVKGPAPDSAKLSWDKSPVANGAHYFLFGRVDPNDGKGVLRESGFGVEFPNYIVDVKKDSVTGIYTEAIQFQCLERGGVRVFEGINFMSRNPTMTESEMTAMHARAEKAGMYPYGASPDQMHTVARRAIDAPEIDNNWQALWRTMGVDKLLQLLTEAIEDGGR